MRKRKPVKESERERTHVDSERPYLKTQVNPEMVLTLELRNIGQIFFSQIVCFILGPQAALAIIYITLRGSNPEQ